MRIVRSADITGVNNIQDVLFPKENALSQFLRLGVPKKVRRSSGVDGSFLSDRYGADGTDRSDGFSLGCLEEISFSFFVFFFRFSISFEYNLSDLSVLSYCCYTLEISLKKHLFNTIV